ncbi:hypothetical protein CPB83DRAFT_761408, partial [Crepidotus variabilis]
VFTVLLFVWKQSPNNWDIGTCSIDNKTLQALIQGFERFKSSLRTLEDIRDKIRHVMHRLRPQEMRFGSYTSVDNVLSSLLISENPAFSAIRKCSVRTFLLHSNAQKYADTQTWMNAEATGIPTNRSCPSCGEIVVESISYLRPPPVLVLEWAGKTVQIEPSISVPVAGRMVPYNLKGVVYYGSSHFVSLLVLGQDVWLRWPDRWWKDDAFRRPPERG